MTEIILRILALCVSTLTYTIDFDCGAFSLTLIEELKKEGISSTVLVVAQNPIPDGYYEIEKIDKPNDPMNKLKDWHGFAQWYIDGVLETIIVYDRAGLYYKVKRIPDSPRKILSHYGQKMGQQNTGTHVWVLERTTGMVLDATPGWQSVANPYLPDRVEF